MYIFYLACFFCNFTKTIYFVDCCCCCIYIERAWESDRPSPRWAANKSASIIRRVACQFYFIEAPTEPPTAINLSPTIAGLSWHTNIHSFSLKLRKNYMAGRKKKGKLWRNHSSTICMDLKMLLHSAKRPKRETKVPLYIYFYLFNNIHKFPPRTMQIVWKTFSITWL